MWRRICRLLVDRTKRCDPLVEFEDGLLLIVDPEQLTNNLRSKLRQFLDIECVMVYLADPGADRTSGGFSWVASAATRNGNGPSAIPVDSRTAEWFRVNQEILIFQENDAVTRYLRDELQPFLEQGMRLAFPLTSMERLIGIVFLSLGQSSVEKSQLANLRVLSRQAGLAFENALLFKEHLRQNERMCRTEQLAMMGQFATGIAHELRNPLTAIRSTVQFLADEFAEDSEQRNLTKTVLDEVDRLNDIASSLLTLAKPAESIPVVVDPREEIDKCTSFIAARARSQNVQLEITCAQRLPRLFIDPAELRQVLLNVMMNSLQAMPDGGILCLKVQHAGPTPQSAARARDGILIEISDQGPGIPMALREKVFEPFFTTKPGGTGLGLPICRSIVRRYDGEIWIEGAEVGGTSVKIFLACA